MVNVAIAGGNGAVGRTIVEVLASHPEHKTLVLTRKSASRDRDSEHFLEVQIDYTDVVALIACLEKHEIHTVISTFGINSTSLSISQLNLIKAANASNPTKRFIPSSFAIAYPEDGARILPLLQHHFTSLEALKKTSLEWAPVINGVFLEYFAPPALKSYHPHITIAVDMEHSTAGIPGDGNVPVTFTYTFDVARFVVAALDLEKWPRELRIVGDELTFHELISIAEDVRGVHFHVSYDPIEKLERLTITELPGHQAAYSKFPRDRLQSFLAVFELWMAKGYAQVCSKGSLNELFPDIKPLSMKDMIRTYWTSD